MTLAKGYSAFLCTRRARRYEAVQLCRAEIAFSRFQRQAAESVYRRWGLAQMCGQNWGHVANLMIELESGDLIARLITEQKRWVGSFPLTTAPPSF